MAAEWQIVTRLSATGAAQTTRALTGVSMAMKGMGTAATATSGRMAALAMATRGMTMALGSAAIAAGALGAAIAGIGVASVRSLADMQRMQVQFNTLYGSSRKGAEMFKWLVAYDVKSPLSIQEMVPLTSQMVAAGMDPKRDLPALLDAIVAFGGGADEASRVMMQLTQMVGIQRATMADIRIMLQAIPGFPGIQILRDAFKVPKGMDIGKAHIPARDAIAVLFNEFDRRYGGASDVAARTISGILSALQTQWMMVKLVIGQTLAPALLNFVTGLNRLLAAPAVRQNIGKLYGLIGALLERIRFLSPEGLARALSLDWLRRLMIQGIALWATVQDVLQRMHSVASLSLRRLFSALHSIEAAVLEMAGGVVNALNSLNVSFLRFMDLMNPSGDPNAARAAALEAAPPGAAYFGRAAELRRQFTVGLIEGLIALAVPEIRSGAIWGVARKRGEGVNALWRRADELARAAMDGVNVPSTENLGRPGDRPWNRNAAGGDGSMIAAAMDAVILWGGGERARATRPWMDIGAGMRRRTPRVEVEVQMRPATTKAMDVAVAEVAEDAAESTLAAILRDPDAIQQLRVALGVA